MLNIINFVKHYFILVIVILGIIITTIVIIISNTNKEEVKVDSFSELAVIEPQEETNNNIYVFVDIKGAVKKPGVYKVQENSIIDDVINLAGGLKTNAITTDINLSKKVKNEMVIYISTKSEFALTNAKKNDDSSTTTQANSNQTTQTPSVASKTTTSSSSNQKTQEVKSNEQTTKINANNDNQEVKVEDYNNETANELYLPENDENTSLVNINTASSEALQTLPSIGEAKADKIIAYREENGLFKTIEDIKNVSGIGDSLYEKIKDYITV